MKVKRKRIDVGLVIGLVSSLLLFLLPKTTFITSLCLMTIFFASSYLVWNIVISALWRVVTLTVVAVAVVMIGLYIWPQTGITFTAVGRPGLTLADAMTFARQQYTFPIRDSGLEDIELAHGSSGTGPSPEDAVIAFINSYGNCLTAKRDRVAGGISVTLARNAVLHKDKLGRKVCQ